MIQKQVNQQGQRLLAIELQPKGAGMTGTLILPFGLELPAGVKLQVDALAASRPFVFITCVYDGCVVPLSLDEVTTAAVRAGNQLKVLAKSNDGTDVAMAVSLRGATSAANRVVSINGQPASAPISSAPAVPAGPE